jgi:phage-related protein
VTQVIYKGSSFTIEAVRVKDGTCPAREFLDSLGERDVARLKALFQQFCERWPNFTNKEMFKKIEGTKGLFEFKDHQVRLPCFFEAGGRAILTHGFRKKANRIPKAEIKRAEDIRSFYSERGKK